MTSSRLKFALALVPILALAGLGCSSPMTGYDQASMSRTGNSNYLPPTYLRSGRRNPDAPPPI